MEKVGVDSYERNMGHILCILTDLYNYLYILQDISLFAVNAKCTQLYNV